MITALKVKLINVNVGIKIDNADQIGEFIKSQNPDIVAFQEIVRHFDNSVFEMYKSKSIIEGYISKDLPYSFFAPQRITNAMWKNGIIHRDFNGFIEQGNEIISRFPIINATNEFYHRAYSLETDRTNFQTKDQPRSLEVVELAIENKRLQILNIHGIYSQDKQDTERAINQCKYILKAAKRERIPTIIVGDFNLFPDTKSIRLLDKEFRNLISEYEITSTRPELNRRTDIKKDIVDYIFVSDKIKVNSFKAINVDISDHLPLLLDFDIIEEN